MQKYNFFKSSDVAKESERSRFPQPINDQRDKCTFEEGLSNGLTSFNSQVETLIRNHRNETSSTLLAIKYQNEKLESENLKLIEIVENVKKEVAFSQTSEKNTNIDKNELFSEISTKIIQQARPQISQQVEQFCAEIDVLQNDFQESELNLKEREFNEHVQEKKITSTFIDSMPDFYYLLDEIHREKLRDFQNEFWTKEKTLDTDICELGKTVEAGFIRLEIERNKLNEVQKMREQMARNFKNEENDFLNKRKQIEEKKQKNNFEREKSAIINLIENEKKEQTELQNAIETLEELEQQRMKKLKEEKKVKIETQKQMYENEFHNCKCLEKTNFDLREEFEKNERENENLQKSHIRKINEAFQINSEMDSVPAALGSAFSFKEKSNLNEILKTSEKRIIHLQKDIRQLKSQIWKEPKNHSAVLLVDLKTQITTQLDKVVEMKLNQVEKESQTCKEKNM